MSDVRKATVEAYILQHPEYVAAVAVGNPAKTSAAKLRLCYSATLACLQHEREIQRNDLTKEDLEKRKLELQRRSQPCAMIHQQLKSNEEVKSAGDANEEDIDVDTLLRDAGEMMPDDLRDVLEDADVEEASSSDDQDMDTEDHDIVGNNGTETLTHLTEITIENTVEASFRPIMQVQPRHSWN